VLLQDGIFCRHVRSIRSIVPFNSRIFLVFLFFCLDDLSVGDKGVLKSPTTIVLGSICDFKDTYKLIVISYCFIAPFTSIKCPSLSLLTNLGLSPLYLL
jgi:hypothetical protein